MKKMCLLALLLASYLSAENYDETLHEGWRQSFTIEEKLFEDKTDLQHLVLFQSSMWGRVLALDGVIQTTEKDEFVYHEMLAHVPIFSHGNAKHVLVIGGGDGGLIREVLRHKGVEKVTLVEIDSSVITFSKQYLPMLSKGAFEDSRLEVVIEDGCKFVKETKERFDVVLCDSTDPIGPGKVLFTSEFYGDCKDILSPKGIFVCQSGVPVLQPDEFKKTYQNLSDHFADSGFYIAVIPTYVGGHMALGWGTNDKEARELSIEDLSSRLEEFSGKMSYYTPSIHKASFALPQFMINILE